MCYYHLYSFLLDYGFVNSRSNPSLFIRHTSTSVVILLVYMDITGSNGMVVTNCVSTLCFAFAFWDLSTFGFFLDMEVIQQPTTLHLSQHHYMVDLL